MVTNGIAGDAVLRSEVGVGILDAEVTKTKAAIMCA